MPGGTTVVKELERLKPENKPAPNLNPRKVFEDADAYFKKLRALEAERVERVKVLEDELAQLKKAQEEHQEKEREAAEIRQAALTRLGLESVPRPDPPRPAPLHAAPGADLDHLRRLIAEGASGNLAPFQSGYTSYATAATACGGEALGIEQWFWKEATVALLGAMRTGTQPFCTPDWARAAAQDADPELGATAARCRGNGAPSRQRRRGRSSTGTPHSSRERSRS